MDVTLGLTDLLLGLPFTLRTKGEGTDSQEGLEREQRSRRFDLESLSREWERQLVYLQDSLSCIYQLTGVTMDT